MKNLNFLFGFALFGLFVFTSCEKGEELNSMELTGEILETATVNQLVEDYGFSIRTLDEDDYIIVDDASQEIEDRGCCQIGNIINLPGGTNRFGIDNMKCDYFYIALYNSNGIFLGWSGIINGNECSTFSHITNLDSIGNIVENQSYGFMVVAYDSSTSRRCAAVFESFTGE